MTTKAEVRWKAAAKTAQTEARALRLKNGQLSTSLNDARSQVRLLEARLEAVARKSISNRRGQLPVSDDDINYILGLSHDLTIAEIAAKLELSFGLVVDVLAKHDMSI